MPLKVATKEVLPRELSDVFEKIYDLYWEREHLIESGRVGEEVISINYLLSRQVFILKQVLKITL